MTPSELKASISTLPRKPGIYLFSSKGRKPFGGKKLYIGKALNLKERVSHYLRTSNTSASLRIQKMISESDKLNFIETESEIEALILESQYIKKYRPDFNIMLRDDKQYSFIVFTADKFPKIFITHQPQGYTDVIGPFTDAGALKTTLRHLRKIFPYCTCKQFHHNYCLNYHIEKCPGFCCLKKPDLRFTIQDSRIYKNNIKSMRDILSGKKESLIERLEKDMKKLSKNEEFEEAITLQRKLNKLKRVFQNAQIIRASSFVNHKSVNYDNEHKNLLNRLAKVIGLKRSLNRIEAYDIANMQGKYAVGAMVVFVNGTPDKNEYRKFKIYMKDGPNDTAMLNEILSRRFKHIEWQLPNLILVDGGKAQLNAAKKVIRDSGLMIHDSRIIALTKNEKHIGHKIILERGKEVSLSKLPVEVKNLLLHIDTEAHRFSISYYRKLHRKSLN